MATAAFYLVSFKHIFQKVPKKSSLITLELWGVVFSVGLTEVTCSVRLTTVTVNKHVLPAGLSSLLGHANLVALDTGAAPGSGSRERGGGACARSSSCLSFKTLSAEAQQTATDKLSLCQCQNVFYVCSYILCSLPSRRWQHRQRLRL